MSKNFKFYAIAFIPSVVIIIVLLWINPDFSNSAWVPYAFLFGLPLVIIALLLNANKEVKKDEQAALEQLKQKLNEIPCAERFALALAQPWRSVFLVMPIGGISDVVYGLYATQCLNEKQWRNARNELAQTGMEGYDAWAEFTEKFAKQIDNNPNKAFQYCLYFHLITCAMDLELLSKNEGLTLIEPMQKKVLQTYTSWQDYGYELRKSIFSSPNNSFANKLSFRMQFRDLNKMLVSPWKLLSWDNARNALLSST